MQTSTAASQGSLGSGGVRKPSGANASERASRPSAGKLNGKAHKPLKRPYKPLPTMRYLVAGLTAILMSMGLIAGAMSATSQFDTKPWDPSQEMRWDPFERNFIPGFDPGALNQSGHRTSEAIPKGGETVTPPPGATNGTNEGTETAPAPAETPSEATPSEVAPAQSPGATFEVPGAEQTPTGSEAPAQGQPPVASGTYGTVGSAGPKA